jgi:hypothetical protein
MVGVRGADHNQSVIANQWTMVSQAVRLAVCIFGGSAKSAGIRVNFRVRTPCILIANVTLRTHR